MWVESTTLAHRPCLIAGRVISGVQVHRPEDRIQDYRGKVAVYRLVPPFLPQEEQYLWRYIQPFLGKGYDRSTVLLAGTKVLRFSRLLPGAWGADLNELFCSELTAAILMQMNKMNWDNPTRYSPARLLRTVVRNGTYTRVKV